MAGVHLERSRKWRLHLDEGVCLDEALHLDDSGASLLDVAGVHLEHSRKCEPFYLEEGVCLDEALHLDDSGCLF